MGYEPSLSMPCSDVATVGMQPLSSERGPFHLELKAKFRLGSKAMDKILVQIVSMDCIREALGGC
jgi:hypothetical protein